MLGDGEFLELVEKEFCRGAVVLEADSAGGEQRAEAADADALVGVVVDQPGVDADEALTTELDVERGGQEFLELVGFDAEGVGAEVAEELDAVGDHLGRGAAGEVGLDVEDALGVDAEGDEGGVVAALGVGALAGVEGEDLDAEVGGPLVEPEAFVEVAGGPLAEVGVEGGVLFFAFEGRPAALGAEAHEGVEVFDLGPKDGCAGVHGFLVPFVELAGGLAGGGVLGVGVDGFPLFPEAGVKGPGVDGAEDAAGPAGGFVEFDGEGLAVEGGGEVDDVGLGGAGLQERAVEPGAGVVALD